MVWNWVALAVFLWLQWALVAVDHNSSSCDNVQIDDDSDDNDLNASVSPISAPIDMSGTLVKLLSQLVNITIKDNHYAIDAIDAIDGKQNWSSLVLQ